MDKIAAQSQEERNELFRESATSRGVLPQIIEKDFWVCWTLDKLFSLPEISPHLIFKGGTSLSKVYGVIERFSEDIDVSINREYLGFEGELDPLNIVGTNKRKTAVEQIKEACKQKVQGSLIAQLQESFSANLGAHGWTLLIDETDIDGQTLLFTFPQASGASDLQGLRYVKPIIRIELGARAEHQPYEMHKIRSYAAEDFPTSFSNPECEIKVLAAERTFWEKATILHDQFHRSGTDKTADRSSRHYYDLFKLAATDIARRAMKDFELLENVVENKKIFFTRAASKYDEALTGNLHLSPNPYRLPALKADYERMAEMFFSEPPTLDTILKKLAQLEEEINSKFN
jgi:predicted nucleotidyltransferase component of viral defense system